ncbi:MAG: SufE family protein [Gammaproteobacteria bacterium]|nr:SufE family protein [Gammaproteobacteria bacterium]
MTTLDEIVDIFDLLGDWDQRYAYLTELGEQMPAMADVDKTDTNKVKGCMSQVWVSAHKNQADNSVYFTGDCDTSIIKGVLALLLQLTDNRSVDEIEKLDVDEFFERLQLDENLSPNRHVGVYAIVDLMKQQARVIGRDIEKTSSVA